jgi:hypothetical protein
MATIKSYTTVEQSRKLAEILPVESADMCYIKHSSSDNPNWEFNEDFPPMILGNMSINEITVETLPCWSLTALLSVLPFNLIVDNQRYAFSMVKAFNKNGETYAIKYTIFNTHYYLHLTDFYNNPVDACVAMIEKLHELKLLCV